MLTRITHKAHGRGLSNREAVAAGLQRIGRLVTAGAIMVAVALGAFGTSHVIFIKELGLGTADDDDLVVEVAAPDGASVDV
jgi:RND superfamily putative drug exporter